jgi:hypothetical protein
MYHNVDDKLNGVTNTVEDVYHTIVAGTVNTANNLVNKTAGVINNVADNTQKALTRSCQKVRSELT